MSDNFVHLTSIKPSNGGFSLSASFISLADNPSYNPANNGKNFQEFENLFYGIYKDALPELSRLYHHHSANINNELLLKQLLEHYYSESLTSNEAYIQKTGTIAFAFCLFFCFNLLFSSLILLATCNLAISFITFSIISYKLISKLIADNNQTYNSYMEKFRKTYEYLNEDLNIASLPKDGNSIDQLDRSSESLAHTDNELSSRASTPERSIYHTPDRLTEKKPGKLALSIDNLDESRDRNGTPQSTCSDRSDKTDKEDIDSPYPENDRPKSYPFPITAQQLSLFDQGKPTIPKTLNTLSVQG